MRPGSHRGPRRAHRAGYAGQSDSAVRAGRESVRGAGGGIAPAGPPTRGPRCAAETAGRAVTTPGPRARPGRALPGVHDVVAGFEQDETVVYTNDFEETIDALLKAGKAGHIRYRSLRVEASNLEDVFLTLTGRRLRE